MAADHEMAGELTVAAFLQQRIVDFVEACKQGIDIVEADLCGKGNGSAGVAA